jgi:hypothetical protein
VSPVTYDLGFISQKTTFHSHCRENLKSYIALTGWALQRILNVSAVRYELGFYISQDGILHRKRREIPKSYIETGMTSTRETLGSSLGRPNTYRHCGAL